MWTIHYDEDMEDWIVTNGRKSFCVLTKDQAVELAALLNAESPWALL